MSRISTLVDTLTPASLHTRAAADSRAYSGDPKTPTENQVEGHTVAVAGWREVRSGGESTWEARERDP